MKNNRINKKLLFFICLFLVMFSRIAFNSINSRAYSYNYLSDSKLVMIKGESKKIKLIYDEENVKWYTSNNKVATVNNGKIRARKKGSATITAIVSDRSYKCRVTVEEPYINKKNVTVSVGEYFYLKMKGTKQSVEWYSSNSKVAYAWGRYIEPRKKGTAYITAKIGKKKYKCKVKVENPKISNNKLEFLLDDKPKKIYLNGTNRKVTWSTTNKNVATVKNGVVTPKGDGYCIISAKVGNAKYECEVNVKNEVNTVYVPMGESWYVPGQWKININSVREYFDEDNNSGTIYVVKYTYNNIGYSDTDGLFFSLDDNAVDSFGQVSNYYYFYDTELYPQSIPVGAYCVAESGICVNHRGNFKIYYSKYDDNGTLRKAVFEVNVPN